MGEVIELEIYNKQQFTITVRIGEKGYVVEVDDFYDKQMDPAQIYREIAETLIPTAGGLLENAEELDPSSRGGLVAQFSLYENGVVDLHTRTIDSEEKLRWFLNMVKKIKRTIKKRYAVHLDKMPANAI